MSYSGTRISAKQGAHLNIIEIKYANHTSINTRNARYWIFADTDILPIPILPICRYFSTDFSRYRYISFFVWKQHQISPIRKL